MTSITRDVLPKVIKILDQLIYYIWNKIKGRISQPKNYQELRFKYLTSPKYRRRYGTKKLVMEVNKWQSQKA